MGSPDNLAKQLVIQAKCFKKNEQKKSKILSGFPVISGGIGGSTDDFRWDIIVGPQRM